MEENLKKNGRQPQKQLKITSKNGVQPQFFLKIEDDLNFLTLENDLNCFKVEDNIIFCNGIYPQKNATLTNSTTQHRQPDQYNNKKLVRAACMRCHGTKCPLITAFFSLSPHRRGYRRVLNLRSPLAN